MPEFFKSDLQFIYKWPSQNGYIPSNLPGDLIEKDNGYHILNFINIFFRNEALLSAGTFTKLERLLYHGLPLHLQTRSEITSWVLKNWERNYYSVIKQPNNLTHNSIADFLLTL